jgi:glycosyltransferase involved in cell wall biosynthesis
VQILKKIMPKACILSSVHQALDNRVFYREALSLLRAGYDVTLIAIHPRKEKLFGINIIGLPEVPRWKRPILWFKLLRLALKKPADIYHFHDPELLVVIPILRLLTGKPTIYDVHEVYSDFIRVKDYLPPWIRYPTSWMFKWIEPLLSRFNTALIFSDSEISKVFSRINKPKIILYNFPSKDFIKRALNVSNGEIIRKPWIIHLGGLERNRGVHLMISAFSDVLRVNQAAHLFLVGHFMPPELEQEVRNRISDLGVTDSVTITGRIPFEKIGDFLENAAVGWLPWLDYPKNQKNIPTKIFEYMAYRLPVVTSDLASTRPFVIDGQNGLRVPSGDVDAHAKAIKFLLHSQKEAREMGRRGQEMVKEKWNWDQEEKKLVGFYKDLLN